jgi:hypothetical protein
MNLWTTVNDWVEARGTGRDAVPITLPEVWIAKDRAVEASFFAGYQQLIAS